MAAGEIGTVTEEDIAPAIDFMPLATMVMDSDGDVLAANPAWLQLSGMTERAAMGSGWQRLVPAEDRLQMMVALRRVAERGGMETVEQALVLDQRRRWTRWTLRRYDRRGRHMVVAVVVDLDAEHSLQMDLRHRATHDALTGLVNRAEFLDLVARAMARRGGRVGLVYVDLDHFKQVNDEGGHHLGDRVLAAAARRLRAGVRPPDVVARVGGDEFAVLCHDLRRADSLEGVARRLRAVLKAPLEIDGNLRKVGATTGISVSQPGCTPEQALDAADRAMYAAKSRRRCPTPQAAGTDAPQAAGTDGSPDAGRPGPGGPGRASRPVRPDPAGSPPGDDEVRRRLVSVRSSLENCALSSSQGGVEDLWAAIDEVDTVLGYLDPPPPPTSPAHPGPGRG